MCGGIEYQGEKIYFPQPGVRLPVRLRDGSVTWIVRVDARIKPSANFRMAVNFIKSGKWKLGTPRPVLIVADQFMETNSC